MNRRIPNGTYGGVRGRGLITPSYSILTFHQGGRLIAIGWHYLTLIMVTSLRILVLLV